MKTILHFLAHVFGWNYCAIDTYFIGEKLAIELVCNTCGKRERVK